MFARPPASGGFVGRVGFFSRHRDDVLSPALVYHFELEGELIARLGFDGRVVLRDVVVALRARGLDEAAIADARGLLITLDALRAKHDAGAAPKVAPAGLRDLVRRGESLLHRLDAQSARGEARR